MVHLSCDGSKVLLFSCVREVRALSGDGPYVCCAMVAKCYCFLVLGKLQHLVEMVHLFLDKW